MTVVQTLFPGRSRPIVLSETKPSDIVAYREQLHHSIFLWYKLLPAADAADVEFLYDLLGQIVKRRVDDDILG